MALLNGLNLAGFPFHTKFLTGMKVKSQERVVESSGLHDPNSCSSPPPERQTAAYKCAAATFPNQAQGDCTHLSPQPLSEAKCGK